MAILRPRVAGGDVATTDGTIAVGSAKQDDVVASIVKWIPVEVIACFEAVMSAFGNSVAEALVYVIPAGMLVTFGWIAFATKDSEKGKDKKANSPIAWRQAWVSSLAFGIWIAGSTSADVWKIVVPSWNPAINVVLFGVGGILLPIFDGILRRLGVRQD